MVRSVSPLEEADETCGRVIGKDGPDENEMSDG